MYVYVIVPPSPVTLHNIFCQVRRQAEQRGRTGTPLAPPEEGPGRSATVGVAEAGAGAGADDTPPKKKVRS